MSRIRLEWNIEAQKIDKSDSEDPQAKRARRRNLLRLFLLVILLLALIAAGGTFLRQRLLDVHLQLEELLRDTVRAEVAALRIGDVYTYLRIQHGENQDWRQRQQVTFHQYNEMKAREDLVLTGKVLDLQVDGQRARAMVEEIINGERFVQVWFYWRDDKGWHHVPPDYGFWGEARSIEADKTVVAYRALDESFAKDLGDSIGNWWRQGCEILCCGSLPILRVAIVTDAAQPLSWIDDSQLSLLVLSPYVERAPADLPFGDELRRQIAEKLAERLVDMQTDSLRVTFPHDVVYLRQAVITYVAEQFLGVDRGASLVNSLVNAYGPEKMVQMLAHFKADADMSILSQVFQLPIEEAKLDWRDFIQWRLNTEADLIAARAESEWLSMYDTADGTILQVAYERFVSGKASRAISVIDQVIWQAPDGSPQLRVTIQVKSDTTSQEEIVLFNLVNGVWKRAS